MGNKNTDFPLRERLRKWMLHFAEKYRHQYPDQIQLANAIGIKGSTMNLVLSGKRGVGVDVLVKMHRGFHVSADVLLDTDPPAIGQAQQNPFSGSSKVANSKRCV